MARQRHLLAGSSSNRLSSPRGVSILEVLFAILITSIGLMGAIAVFPAAMLQAKRGQQADAAAIAGTRCLHAFDAQGMRRPDRWMYYNGSNYVQVPAPNGSVAYCIDPRFIAANQNDSSANNFPYSSTASVVQRVTLHNGLTGANAGAMNALLAELNFRIDDDIAYDRYTGTFNNINVDKNSPAGGLFARDSSNNPLKRETHGHMSWMATLSPKVERLPTGGALEDRYVLSTVIFQDRPVQLDSDVYPVSDWSLNVNMGAGYGGGITGGDMRLSLPATGVPAGDELRRVSIQRDQWIMLVSYTSINSGGNTRISPLCRWYRVIDADIDETNYTVDVTLFGADWENTGQTVYAVVCQGVIAVYEKTIKLETRL